MARPTKYRPEFCKSIVRYFEDTVAQNELPFLSKWARQEAKVCEDTAIEWTKAKEKNFDGEEVLKYPEFSESYKKAKDIQKEFLIKMALAGKYNPTFAIFTAKNITDMRDQKDVDLTSKGERMGVVILPPEND